MFVLIRLKEKCYHLLIIFSKNEKMKYEIDSEAVSETVMYVEEEVNELNFIMRGLVLHESKIDCETLLKTVMDAETEVNELNFKMQDLVLHTNETECEIILKTVMDTETKLNEVNIKKQESALHENEVKVEQSPSKKIVLFASMKAL